MKKFLMLKFSLTHKIHIYFLYLSYLFLIFVLSGLLRIISKSLAHFYNIYTICPEGIIDLEIYKIFIIFF